MYNICVKKRILWVDAIRVLCALHIVGYHHYREYIDLPSNFINVDLAYYTLATFTFISGYFSSNNNVQGVHDGLKYYKKKLIRIYPLFTLSGVLFLFCGYNSAEIFIRSQLGIGLFIEPYPKTLWFVCMLFIFWFITPLITRKYNLKKSLIVFTFFSIIFYLCKEYFCLDKRLYMYWVYYYLGLITNKQNYIKYVGKNLSTIVISIIVFLAYEILRINNLQIISGLCFIYAISNIAYYLFGKVEHNKAVEFISYSSMCAYIFHRPFFAFCCNVFGELNIMVAYLIVLPLLFVTCFGIQKSYDAIVCKLQNI